MLVIAFCLWRLPDFWRNKGSGQLTTFSLLYLLYLGAIIFSLAAGYSQPHSVSLFLRYFVYFGMFVVCTIVLRSNFFSEPQLAKCLYRGCLLGIVLFLALATYFFLRVGRNFPLELFTSIIHGDAESLRFRIFLTLLNYSSDEIDRSSDSFVAVSRINTVSCGFVLAIQLVWMYRYPARLVFSRRLSASILWFVSTASMLLILGSTSRTNTASILIAITIAVATQFFNSQKRSERGNIAILSLVSIGTILLATLAAAPFIGLDDMINERFGVDVLSSDSRIAQYLEAWDRIRRRPVSGYGLGEGVDLGNDGGRTGQQVHNLFLAAWFEIGIAGLVSSLLFYGYAVVAWVRAGWKTRLHHSTLKDSIPSMGWYLGLTCLPFVRAMFSGQGGNFSMTEWICLAFFFAVSLRLTRAPIEAGILETRTGEKDGE